MATTMQLTPETMGAALIIEIGIDWMLEVITDEAFWDFMTQSAFEVADWLFYPADDEYASVVFQAVIDAHNDMKAVGRTPKDYSSRTYLTSDGEMVTELDFTNEGFVIIGEVGNPAPPTAIEMEAMPITAAPPPATTGGTTVATNGEAKPKVMTSVEDLNASAKESFFGTYKAENGKGFNRFLNDGWRAGTTVWSWALTVSLAGNAVLGWMSWSDRKKLRQYQEECGQLEKEKKAALGRAKGYRAKLKKADQKFLPASF